MSVFKKKVVTVIYEYTNFHFFLYFEVGPVTKHVHLGDRQNEVRQCVIMNAYSKRGCEYEVYEECLPRILGFAANTVE